MGLMILFAGLVIAADQLLNMADRNTQDAAAIGADDEMAAIKATTVKPQKKDNIAWSQIQQYERQLQQNTNQYQKLVAQAGTEKQTGNGVSASTRQAGMDSAQKFNQISEQLAATWEKGNCITRAKTVREAGKSRIANAEMAFNNFNGDNISAYNKQRTAMSDSGIESLKEVKSDASPEDIAKLKAGLIPQLNKMIADNTKLISQIGELLNQIRAAGGGDPSAMAGCAASMISGTASEGPAALLRPVMSLMDMVKGMGSSLASTLGAVTSL